MGKLTITKNAQAFLDANAKSPVVSGAAIGSGGKGGRYTLRDGKRFTLSRDESEMIGCPRWDI